VVTTVVINWNNNKVFTYSKKTILVQLLAWRKERNIANTLESTEPAELSAMLNAFTWKPEMSKENHTVATR